MEIYKKLLEVQKEVGAISKDNKNPFFKSKYFDVNRLIEHVNPILTKNGLLLIQPIKDGLQASIIIDSENGESVESYLKLPDLTDPQKLGSAITYYRRYTLCSLLALQAEDDDANIASKAKKSKPKVKDFDGLMQAVVDGKVTKDKALSSYDLSSEQIEKINKV